MGYGPDDMTRGVEIARGKLKTIDLAGGSLSTLSDAPLDSRGGTWNRDGTIVFAPNANGVLYRVSARGGAATPVTTLDKARQENGHRFPQFLPDGRHYLYEQLAADNSGLYVGALDSKDRARLAGGST
jgi:Tol biopolymer transport system component